MFFVSRLHLDRQPAEPLEHPEDAKFLKYPTRSARCASRCAQTPKRRSVERTDQLPDGWQMGNWNLADNFRFARPGMVSVGAFFALQLGLEGSHGFVAN